MVGTMAKIDDSVKKEVPELRFKGFTDDWEKRKLSDIADKAVDNRGKTPTISEDGNHPLLEVASLGNGAPDYSKVTKYLSDETFMTELRAYIKEGDILFSTVGSIGLVSLMDTNENAAIAQNIVAFRANEKYDSKFLYAMLSKKENQHKAQRIVMGAVQPSIKVSQLVDVDYCVTENMEEQRKLGEYFLNLDNLIALYQRKLDLLKEQKKGFLQKMFPKNGAKVPELRFKGFTDDWEERKLSDVANHRGGTAIEKYFDKDGVYKVISIGSYGLNSQYVDQNIRAISNEITDGRVVNSGELTMVLNDKTANGTIIGRTLLVEKDNEYVINQRTEIISPKENFDSNFAYTILNGPFREKVKRIVQGGTQIYVNYPAVSNLNLELPKIEEQQKIGTFFKQLDDIIALHQRKLDLLKEQKKGFLQKMFV